MSPITHQPTPNTLVNDVHSRLNQIGVCRVIRPDSTAAVRDAVIAAGREGRSLAIAGGRHAMGGQQFAAGSDLLDMTALDRVIEFDPERGEIEAEAGLVWWATRAQMEAAHPRFVPFLREKLRFDPNERFQSDWYRHYREMFRDVQGVAGEA